MRLSLPTNRACQAKLKSFSRMLCIVGYLIFSTAATNTAIAVDAPPPGGTKNQKVLRFAMVDALGGVNLKDAMVAIDLHWSRHLFHMFPSFDSQFEFLENEVAARQKIKENWLHGLSLGIVQYLKLSKNTDLKPIFISSRQSQPLESYLLLVPRGTDWQSLKAQPSKQLITEKMDMPNIGQMWLETVMDDRKLPQSHQFFSNIASAGKPARIILPVFFGQADACLVPESAYQTMVELNPQINQRLTVLERSPGYIKTIHCATDLMPPQMLERFIKNGISMDDSVDGRQLLIIFHVKKNFPYQPEYLTNSQNTFDRYRQIMHKTR